MAERAEVRNVADREQVKRAGRKVERVERDRLDALRRVLNTVDGRRVFWDLLTKAGVYRSIFNPHGGVQSYNAGKQDFGHEIVADLLKADERLYLQMESEARTRARTETETTEAGHTASVVEKEAESESV